MTNLFLLYFRDLKANQSLVHQAILEHQVHQASQAMVDQDRLAHQDHQGLQDSRVHLLDMAQVESARFYFT